MNVQESLTSAVRFLPYLLHREEFALRVNSSAFLTRFSQPTPRDSTYLTLVLSGGVDWRKESHGQVYLPILHSQLQDSCIFILRLRTAPIEPYDLSAHIHEALQVLRITYQKPIIVVGISIGGFLLGKYLIDGYDDAERYFICIAHLCSRKFNTGIEEDYIVRWWKKRSEKLFTDMGYADIYTAYLRETEGQEENFLMLSPSRQQKVYFLYAEKDAITRGLREFITRSFAQSVCIRGGYHCSYITISSIPRIIREKMIAYTRMYPQNVAHS